MSKNRIPSGFLHWTKYHSNTKAANIYQSESMDCTSPKLMSLGQLKSSVCKVWSIAYICLSRLQRTSTVLSKNGRTWELEFSIHLWTSRIQWNWRFVIVKYEPSENDAGIPVLAFKPNLGSCLDVKWSPRASFQFMSTRICKWSTKSSSDNCLGHLSDVREIDANKSHFTTDHV